MKKTSREYLFGVLLLTGLFLMTAPVSADTQWEQSEIYNQVNSSVIGMDISGDYIIFLTSSDKSMNQSSNRVHLYDAITKNQKIIGVPSQGMTVTGNDISGNYAVWFETQTENFELDESETKPNTIYLMDIAKNTTKSLSLPKTAQWPKISGDTILFSETPRDSFETDVSIYDIATKKTIRIFNISPEDPAGIVYDNGNIGYTDSKGVHIYNIKSETDSVIFTPESNNESGSDVMDFDMARDYMIYFKHQVVYKGDNKGLYDEPYLYTISTGKTSLLNPITGNFTDSLTKTEKKASIASPFTDGETVGWGYLKSETGSDIIILKPKTGDSSVITIKSVLSDAKIDGEQILWTASDFMSFKDTLYLAKENKTDGESPSNSAPGFSVFIGILGISLCVFLLRKVKE